MFKRLLSLLLSFCILFFNTPNVLSAQISMSWSIKITSIKLIDRLHTTIPEIAYDGTVTNIDYDNYPKKDNIFAIVGLNVIKNEVSAEALNIENIYLNIGTDKFSAMSDYSFLDNHNYTSLSKYNGYLQADTQGYICFEIPEKFANDKGEGWTVSTNKYNSSPYIASNNNELPVEPTLTERQAKIEKSLINQFNAQKDKSINNALVSLNPYEISPLTALIIFDTEKPSTISVKVRGKAEETDISYKIDGEKTHHEIPVFGMYGGYDNHVVIEASTGEYREFIIQTADLPETLPTYTSDVTDKSSFDNNGLIYVLGVPYRHCIDINGDIRWYSPIKQVPATPEETNSDSTYWSILNIGSLAANIINLDYMGKILKSYSYFDMADHHDIDITDDNKILWFNNNTIISTDINSGEYSVYLRLSDIIDPNVGYIDFRNNPEDFAHPNTIEYNNGKLYLSLRNQSMLIKIDYATKQIEWVATPGLTYDEKGNITGALQKSVSNYIVIPKSDDKDFEWFWSQHDISIMPDQDNNPYTDDFTLFDNGVYRGNPNTPETEMYSRLVQYRVDTKNKTIEQIFEYDDKNNILYSHHMGGTQALNNGQFGCFAAVFDKNTNKYNANLLEVNSSGEKVASWISNGYEAYRAYYYPIETFITQDINLSNSVPAFEYYKTTEWADYKPELPTSDGLKYEIKNLSVSENNILNITGWAVIDGYSSNFAKPFLVAKGKNVGNKYILLQHGYNEIAIPANLINKGDYSSGFWGVGVDLSLLPDDEYTLGLLVNANGTDQWRYVDLGYKYTKINKSVKQDDILENQKIKNQKISEDFNANSYTLNNPMIVVNPYEISPLSAIASFKTDKPASITVEIEGKNGAKPVKNEFETISTEHYIPIYGLYANEKTNVKITAKYNDGTQQSKTVSITGNNLPSDFVPIEVTRADTEKMANGWTFVISGSLQGYIYAIDETGAVRWIFTEKGVGATGGLLELKNGNYLIGGEKSFGQYYKYNLLEVNLTGQIINEYLIDGYHHDVQELPNGNILLLANNVNGNTVEDTVYELDRKTGNIVKTWDLNSYFNVGNLNSDGKHISDENYGSDSHDWLHTNGLFYDEKNNSAIISSRHQDAVFSMNLETGEINWILSDPNDKFPPYLKDRLLKSTGGGTLNQQYGQHNVSLLPNGDLMLFDNGNYRSKTKNSVLPASEGYSRAIIYNIDDKNMTANKVWEFGKEYGSELLSSYVSSSQYISDNHYLIDFGGIVKDANGNPTYEILEGINGSSQSQIFEVKDNEVIFHAQIKANSLNGNSYRAVRHMPYISKSELDIKNLANRIGSLYRMGDVKDVEFDPNNAVLSSLDVNIVDNGVQIEMELNLGSKPNNASIIFYNGQSAYEIQLANEQKLNYTINNSEIPTGNYRIYIKKDGITYDNKLEWTNSSDYRKSPSGYTVTLANETPNMGSVYGSGVYYENTPFTISAKANSGYKFKGWYISDKLVSDNKNYTITPTSDMSITAKFVTDSVNGFTDVSGHWAIEAIDFVTKNNIFNGTSETTFSPNNTMTRAMLMTVLARYDGVDTSSGATWYEKGMNWAIEKGISDGTLPESSITREQLVTMLWRYSESPKPTSNKLSNYKDSDQISEWAKDAMAWAMENNIISGVTNDELKPQGNATRAQVATIIMRFIKIK